MLGIGPAPDGPAAAAPQVYSAPLTGALLVILGFSALVLLAMMPGTLGAGWLPMSLLGLPLAIGGAGGVLIGYGVLSTRIEIVPDGIAIAAPGWRAFPFPPARHYRLGWADLRSVRRRTEVYHLGRLPLRLPVEVYAIETAEAVIALGAYCLADLEPVLIDLAQRADRPWHEDDVVEADLLRTLVYGGPPWPATSGRFG